MENLSPPRGEPAPARPRGRAGRDLDVPAPTRVQGSVGRRAGAAVRAPGRGRRRPMGTSPCRNGA